MATPKYLTAQERLKRAQVEDVEAPSVSPLTGEDARSLAAQRIRDEISNPDLRKPNDEPPIRLEALKRSKQFNPLTLLELLKKQAGGK